MLLFVYESSCIRFPCTTPTQKVLKHGLSHILSSSAHILSSSDRETNWRKVDVDGPALSVPFSEDETHNESRKKSSAEEFVCAICLGPYEVGDEVSWSMNTCCNHVYHHKCISEWLVHHDECPCCRLEYLHLSPPMKRAKCSVGNNQPAHEEMDETPPISRSRGRFCVVHGLVDPFERIMPAGQEKPDCNVLDREHHEINDSRIFASDYSETYQHSLHKCFDRDLESGTMESGFHCSCHRPSSRTLPRLKSGRSI